MDVDMCGVEQHLAGRLYERNGVSSMVFTAS
jgi:hypothetical protein